MLSAGATLFFGVTFGAALVCFLLALGQVLLTNRNRGNYLLCLIYGLLALIQISLPLRQLDGFSDALPAISNYFPLPRFILAPLLVIYFQELILERPLKVGLRGLHFVPAILLSLCFAPFFVLDLLNLSGLLSSTFPIGRKFFLVLVTYSGLLSNVYLILYFAPLLSFIRKSTPDLASGRRVLRAVSIVLLASTLVMSLNILHFFLELAPLVIISSLLLSFIIFAIFLMGYRFPELLHIMRMEAYEERRSDSPLKGLDLERLNARLRLLMEQERLFCDEDLDLKTVAEALEIRPNQLTYFLNHVHEKNFSAFINGYRVEAAKELLRSEPNRSVLSIGFGVGFNSKSSFYRVFQELSGVSPSAYRKD